MTNLIPMRQARRPTQPPSVASHMVTSEFVVLRGRAEGKSILEDLDVIGRWLAYEQLLETHRVLWRDVTGSWGELTFWTDGRPRGAIDGGARSASEAMELARKGWP